MDKAVALKAIDAAREMGFNFFDMAPLYGTGKKDGVAEFILGKGLRICRKEVIVSTKFGRKPAEGNKAVSTVFMRVGQSKKAFRDSLQTTLICCFFTRFFRREK